MSAAASEADEGQPPGRLGRRLLLVLDADEDAGRRERDLARARGHGAQQPIDDRQRGERGEQPRIEEGQRAKAHGRASRGRVSFAGASGSDRRRALPAVIAVTALKPHDERQQRLGGGTVGVVHEERPAEPLGNLGELGAVRLEPLLVSRAHALHAVGDPAVACL